MLPLVEPQLVRGGVHALEVPDAAMRDQTLEAVRVDREPVHHVAAERRARSADAVLIDPRLLVEPVQALHEVVVALAAPVAADLIDVLLAEAGRAARIGQSHDVALGCPKLWVPAVTPTILPRA